MSPDFGNVGLYPESGNHRSQDPKKKRYKKYWHLEVTSKTKSNGFTLPWLVHSSLNPTSALPPFSPPPDPLFSSLASRVLPPLQRCVSGTWCATIFEVDRNTLQKLTRSWEGSVTMSSTFEEETGTKGTSETVVLIEEIQEDVLIFLFPSKPRSKMWKYLSVHSDRWPWIGRGKQRKTKITDIIPQ